MRGQLFAPLLRDLGQTGVQPLQVLKLVQQLGGAFGSNACLLYTSDAADD